jgi:hypothetical protein
MAIPYKFANMARFSATSLVGPCCTSSTVAHFLGSFLVEIVCRVGEACSAVHADMAAPCGIRRTKT